ncbi:hypothetical protein MSAN_00806600 [Mycena sanguinolenta]|uniref:Uncharacterized protein n=1 Tax=Mycena sanguinolenta TaxID=230812 RepID=A0A8H6YY80_9AGAR|nr:hypothetical protein MSAN_00806600 [Mycena sanguinolenta]
MSNTFNDENIDPALRAMDNISVDPAANMLEKLRAGNSSAPPSSPGTPANDDDMDEDQLSGMTPISGFTLGTPSLTPGGPTLVAFGNAVKHQVKLSEKSAVAFDQFLRLRTPEERNIVLFAHVLELLDISRRNERAEQFVISPTLGKKIRTYTLAFFLSPQLSAYRGPKASEHILNAMRDCKISELPPDSDTTSVQSVLSSIGERATHYRNVIKTTVASSLQHGSPLKNIAALTSKLVQGSTLKATSQLYIRLAFIRYIMVEYPWLNEETFWLKVDEVIAQNSKSCETEKELNKLYNLFYKEDIMKHGDPATTAHKTSEFSEVDGGWQGVIRKHSVTVLPNPKGGQILLKAYQTWLAAQPTESRKRRRTDDVVDGAAEGI